MVPNFRWDDVWTPAFAGVTTQETFYEIIIFDPVNDPVAFVNPYSPVQKNR
jgi:hypothetical protein